MFKTSYKEHFSVPGSPVPGSAANNDRRVLYNVDHYVMEFTLDEVFHDRDLPVEIDVFEGYGGPTNMLYRDRTKENIFFKASDHVDGAFTLTVRVPAYLVQGTRCKYPDNPDFDDMRFFTHSDMEEPVLVLGDLKKTRTGVVMEGEESPLSRAEDKGINLKSGSFFLRVRVGDNIEITKILAPANPYC